MKYVAAILMFGLFLSCQAAEAATFKIVKSGATPLSELTVPQPRAVGIVNRFVPPAGSVLLLVEMEVAAVLGKEEDSLSLHTESFGVYDGNTKLPLIFDFSKLTGDTMYFTMNFYRGGDQPVENELYRVIVMAPANKNSFTLRMAPDVWDEKASENKPGKPVEAQLKVEGKPKPFAYSDYLSLQVTSMKFVDSISRKHPVTEVAYSTMNPGGSILAVHVKMSAKPSFLSPEGFVEFDSSAVGLTFGKGGSCGCIGYGYADQPGASGDVYEGSLTLGGKDKYSDVNNKALILYFPVPSNLRVFNVMFGGQQLMTIEIPATVKP